MEVRPKPVAFIMSLESAWTSAGSEQKCALLQPSQTDQVLSLRFLIPSLRQTARLRHPNINLAYKAKENKVALYISTLTAKVSERRAMFDLPFQVTTFSTSSPVSMSQSEKLKPSMAGICG